MSSNEVKVGALTLGGAVLLAGMISFMGAFSFGSRGYKLEIDYPSVSGLSKGNVVRYAGVQVGTVKNIIVAPDKVIVETEINKDIKIPQGATFGISADGMMSEKYVSITPPKIVGKGFISEGSVVRGKSGGGMDEFFNASGNLAAKMEKIADSFDSVFGDKDVQAAMRDGFINLRDITKNMNDFTRIMSETALASQKDITTMVQQMNLVTQHMESIMQGIDANGATGRNVAVMADNLANTSRRMENTMAVLESIATDPQTKTDIKETLKNIKQTTSHANKLAKTLSSPEFSADVGHSWSGNDWRSSLGVTLKPTDVSSLYMGVYDMGDQNKFDFIYGHRFGAASASLGSMQGEFGIGLSYDFGKQFTIYTQAYDFNDLKIRLGGEYKLTNTLSVYSESMNLKGNKTDAYVGMRAHF